MKNSLNLEVEKAYKKISGEKNSFGKYYKTLFHVHTPESHDYKVFFDWKGYSESSFKQLTIEDYINEIKKQKLFPDEYFLTENGEKVFYRNYEKNGFKDEIDMLSFLIVAQSLYNQGISTVVVSDHNTILGIKKLKKAIDLLSDLSINKEKIKVISGLEISCADRVHVLVAFPEYKTQFIEKWLIDNLMNENEGTFKASLEVLDTFLNQGFITYIAHINSSDVFNEGKHFSNAYKKKLFSSKYANYMGVSNSLKISQVQNFLSNINKALHPSFLLDNDSHCIEEHDRNPMWVKFSSRNYEQLKEALSEYDVSVELDNPRGNNNKVIRGLFIPQIKNSFLLNNNSDFVLKFSESLNCLIGGRGTGKSTILDLLQLILSQNADSKQKFEFLTKHSRVYVLYEMFEKEYIVELNLPVPRQGEEIYDTYGVRTKSTTKFWFYSKLLKTKIKDSYLSIYEVLNSNQFKKVNKSEKYDLVDKMFDNRYSVNQLVNIASDEKISDFLYNILSKDKEFAQYKFQCKIFSKSSITSIISLENIKLKKQENDLKSVIMPFNEYQADKLQIVYSQKLDYYIPENFENWFFPEGKNLNNPFQGYRITHREIVEYLSTIFLKRGFINFVNIMNSRELDQQFSIENFSKNTELSNNISHIDLIEIDENNITKLFEKIYNLWDNSDNKLIQSYLNDIYNNCEKLSLEFNINSKVTDGSKKPIFKIVSELSLGQKVVAMLDFILAYSEFTNDNRPLLIDQPEDNLDSRYIYNNLVKVLREVKYKRQIIIATHNATIVTNAMSDLVVLMDSDGEHGWVSQTGYPSEKRIKKYIVNYLEGGKESFEHKVKMYQDVIDIHK
ncbi:Spaf_1101 family AAA-like ATPase [Streptococcus himalayensis]|uniref:Endonuclease GajA/Old nuclease/RecF-like AAA domain-containing protein n=1 Tax=Streptococcus himalayensis TaxID=1888195 RepID=A0A917EFU2_9STRE|nr:AAA family ATPase [Streptococcus himalayensis]GGE34456.1 hypothetical protein GCM10011510_14740 [Streptococcus himalayensis]